MGISYFAFGALPPAPQPPENQITEAKRVLGKILFSEEQVSSNNRVSCASCHTISRGGTESRPPAVNPGPDGIFGTPDDRQASPGVIHSTSDNDYVRDAIYGLAPQATGRAANSPINAAYAFDLFWDGRARTQFVDPETNEVAIVNGGGLESQAVNPPVSSVEMQHDGIDWTLVTNKLARVHPLDLSTNIPPDVAATLVGSPSYPELFRRAFGDTAITARRIAFAIASYERTLISDQTPWDRFDAGQTNALTPQQVQGMNAFQRNCAICHVANQPGPGHGMFTDHSFRNIGLRPPTEDLGRQIVTGDTNDRGKFKVPTLRNVGLQQRFMHNGQFTNFADIIRFYVRAPGSAPSFLDNRDPAINAITPQTLPPTDETPLVDFLTNALTDPRVANQQFPFDRPTLYTERAADQPQALGGGASGSGGFVPRIIAQDPPMIGNLEFRIGLDQALGGTSATLGISSAPPLSGSIVPQWYFPTESAVGTGAGQGVATTHWPLTVRVAAPGQVVYAQWFVDDPGAAGGQARSQVVKVTFFCGSSGCPGPCGSADFNNDGDSGTDADIDAFFACLAGNCCLTCNSVDFNGDGDIGTDADIESFFSVLAGGSCS
jgi:cytochrome c peroxidase